MLINGINFQELLSEPSPSDRVAIDNGETMRRSWVRGLIDGDTRQRVKAALLGWTRMSWIAYTMPLGNGRFRHHVYRWLARQTPHGIYTGNVDQLGDRNLAVLYCTSIEKMEPMGKRVINIAQTIPTPFNGVVVEARYNTLPYFVRSEMEVLPLPDSLSPLGPLNPHLRMPRPDEGDALRRGWHKASRYVSLAVDGTTAIVSMPQGILHYVQQEGEQAQPVPIGAPFPLFRQRITYTWHQVPLAAIPFQAISRTENAVNDAHFDRFPAGTLRLDRWSKRMYQCGFSHRWYADVVYQMEYQPNVDPVTGVAMGWNSLPRAVQGKLRFWPVRCGPTQQAESVFPRRPFPLLFIPDQLEVENNQPAWRPGD